jgi:hypothetical protein
MPKRGFCAAQQLIIQNWRNESQQMNLHSEIDFIPDLSTVLIIK